MNSKVPNDMLIWAVKSISGEVTTNMRMIAFSFGSKCAEFRFYMSKEPSEEEKEIGEIIAVNFDSGLPFELKKLDVVFVVTNEPLGQLDSLDFILFRRWEQT